MKTLACGVAALLALAAPAVAKRSTRRQANLGEIPDPTDVEGWCQNIDLRDEELVGWVWNDWSVGWYMDVMISKSFSPPNEDWVVKFGKTTLYLTLLYRARNDLSAMFHWQIDGRVDR